MSDENLPPGTYLYADGRVQARWEGNMAHVPNPALTDAETGTTGPAYTEASQEAGKAREAQA